MDRSWEYHAKRYKSDKKCQEPHDFIHRWDTKPHDFTHMRKATNEQMRKTNTHRQYGGHPKEYRVKGVKYMVMEGGLTLGDKHTMQYT